jgi:exodeoxyribonuclease VII small subunit
MSESFEESLRNLEEIVRKLEEGNLSLEESLELFEKGMALSRQCQERLNQIERKIELLLKDEQGRPFLSEYEDKV